MVSPDANSLNPEQDQPTIPKRSDDSLVDTDAVRPRHPKRKDDATLTYIPAGQERTPNDRPHPSLTQRSFGDYELLRVIAHGGMGVVYQARDTKLHRIVALKMIRTGLWASGEEVQRFYEEAEAAAHLDHPGIVPIYGMGQHEGQHYFSMGYVEGGSLSESVKEGPLPPRKAAALTQSIAEAVAYAHERGVIHRDLKPGNVLLDKDGRPKITDFGLAKRVQGTSNLTVTGQVLGTPNYMPPEQASGKVGQIGPLADVYSLGALLYCLVTGRPPFQAASPVETLQQVIDQEPVPPRELNAGIDYDLETICLRCLQKEPAKRYDSAKSLAEDLCRFLADEPIAARRVSQIERAVRWCRRKPALACSIGSAVVLLLAVTVISIWFGLYHRQKAKELSDKEAAIEAALTASQHQSAVVMLERGLGYCEKQEEALGMIWLAQSLRQAPAEDEALRRMLLGNLSNWQTHIHPLRAIFPLNGEPMGVAFSPDGKSFVTGHDDNFVSLWETATGKKLWSLKEHKANVWTVAFSPDGKTIISGGDDQTVRFWDAATGRPIRDPLPTEKRVRSLAYCLDGKMFMVAEDYKVQLFDAPSGQPRGEPIGLKGLRALAAAAVSPDGTRIVTACMDSNAYLWNTRSGEQIGSPLKHNDSVWAVAFSRDGQKVLTGSFDQTARVWNAHTGEPMGPPLQHGERVRVVAFSPDGKLALTGGFDNTARLWDVATGRQQGAPLHHRKGTRALQFHPQGKTVLVCDADKTARIWEVANDSLEKPVMEHQVPVSMAVFSSDGKFILTASGRQARLWNAATGLPVGKVLDHDEIVSTAALSPYNKIILTKDTKGAIRFWDAEKSEPLSPPLYHPEFSKGKIQTELLPVQPALFSPNGKIAVTVIGNQAQLWDTQTRKPRCRPLEHARFIYTVAFDSTSTLILTGGSDNKAQLWEVASGERRGFAMQHPDTVRSSAFSPDGKWIITGCSSGGAFLWDVDTGDMKPVFPPRQDEVQDVAFSPDGQVILSGSSDTTACFWDSHSGRSLGQPLQHHGEVYRVSFSPDGRLAATASGDWTARVWDVATAKPIGPPLQHSRAVTQVAFSPAGRWVLTGSDDGTARLWIVRPPLDMDFDRVTLWLSVATGLEMDETGTTIQNLDAQIWLDRRQQLGELK